MSSSSPAECVVKTARQNVIDSVDRFVKRVSSGERYVARKNPFAEDTAATIPVPDMALANALIERGLHKDDAFMSLLRAGLIDLAAQPLFHLFSSIDGEGAWEGDIQVELRTLDGKSVGGTLHDTFYPIESGSTG